LVLIVGVGFLGGFTTFSTWIMQMVVQFENGDYSGAFYNLSGSLITGTIAAVLGFYLLAALL
jgi:fluoride exporter